MSFLQVRQSTLTGERKTFINAAAIAYLQEIKPDQDLIWQIGVEPSRSLIFLHQKLEPIISLDNFDDLVRQANNINTPSTRIAESKIAKKVK